MAEVLDKEIKLTITGNTVLTYVDEAVLITTQLASPNMTYIDQEPQVTTDLAPLFMTYTNGVDVELEYPLKRNISNSVELSYTLTRNVESSDPWRVETDTPTIRKICVSVELEYITYRHIVSYNVGLEKPIWRRITKDVELEYQIQRDINTQMQLNYPVMRIVVSDDQQDTEDIPTKEYESFIEKNKLMRVQHDVLDEELSDNPYLEKQISNLRNAALYTKNQTIIKAINELFVDQKEVFNTTFNAIQKFNSQIGDIVQDRELQKKYQRLGYESITDAIIKLHDNIDKLIKFIGLEASDLDEENEFGYKNLIEALEIINENIANINLDWDDMDEGEAEWVLSPFDYIPDVKDTVFGLIQQIERKIEIFTDNIEHKFLELREDTETTTSNYYQALLEKLQDFDDATREEIHQLFLQGEEEENYDPFLNLLLDIKQQIIDYQTEIHEVLDEFRNQLQDFDDATQHEIERIFSALIDPDDQQSFEEVITTQIHNIWTEFTDFQDKVNIRFNEVIERLSDIFVDASEEEIKLIFSVFEDNDAAEEWEDTFMRHMHDLEGQMAQHKEYTEPLIEQIIDIINSTDNITEEQIRNLFSIFDTIYDDEQFEAILVDEINGLKIKLRDYNNNLVNEVDDIKEQLNQINDITEIEVRNIFAYLEDYYAEQEFIEVFSNRLQDLENKFNTHVQTGDELHQQFIEEINSWTDIDDQNIRDMFAIFNDIATDDNFQEWFEDRFNSLYNDLNNYKTTTDNRFNDVYDNLALLDIDEEEIREIFKAITEDYTEEDFENIILNEIDKLREEYNNFKQQSQDTLDQMQSIVDNSIDITNDDVYDIFKDFVDELSETDFTKVFLETLKTIDEDTYNLFDPEENIVDQIRTLLNSGTLTDNQLIAIYQAYAYSLAYGDIENVLIDLIQSVETKLEKRLDDLDPYIEQLKDMIDNSSYITETEVISIFKDIDQAAEDNDYEEMFVLNLINTNEELANKFDLDKDIFEQIEEKLDNDQLTIEEINILFDVLFKTDSSQYESVFLTKLQEASDVYDEKIANIESDINELKSSIIDWDNVSEDNVIEMFKSDFVEDALTEEEFNRIFYSKLREANEAVYSKFDTTQNAVDQIRYMLDNELLTDTEKLIVYQSYTASLSYDDIDTVLVDMVDNMNAKLDSKINEFEERLNSYNDSASNYEDITETETTNIFKALENTESEELFEDIFINRINSLEDDIDRFKEEINNIIKEYKDSLSDYDNIDQEDITEIFESTLISSATTEEEFNQIFYDKLKELNIDVYNKFDPERDCLEQISTFIEEESLTDIELYTIYQAYVVAMSYEDIETTMINMIDELDTKVTNKLNEFEPVVEEMHDYINAQNDITEEDIRKVFDTEIEVDGEFIYTDVVDMMNSTTQTIEEFRQRLESIESHEDEIVPDNDIYSMFNQ